MAVNRRQVLMGMLAAGLLPGVIARSYAENLADSVLLSAQGKQPDSYGFGWVKKSAVDNAQSIVSGFRGHGVTQHPVKANIAIMFARRPGTQCVEVDLINGEMGKAFSSESGRHLLGHGCFTKDGKYLLTAELAHESGEGKIVVRDALSYQHLSEFSSHGIGPHEIKMLPDAKTLVVANGGIQTHPKTGRKKLNLQSMHSSLTYLDIEKGDLLGSFSVAEPKASIRHLDVANDGSVAFGMQMQRSVAGHNHIVPLAGVHRPGNAPELFNQPDSIIHCMNDYAGSVAINHTNRVAGFTSPRGNIAVFWHLDSGELVGYHQFHDVCGLTVSLDQKHFVVSNSSGQIRFLNAVTIQEDESKRIDVAGMSWDNHLLMAAI